MYKSINETEIHRDVDVDVQPSNKIQGRNKTKIPKPQTTIIDEQ